MPSLHVEIYRFGQFELDIAAGELRRNTRRVRLQPQPFKLLVLLARRAGTLVPREDIRSELWPDGTFVDFDQSVNFAVKQIRDVLGDSAESPLYIETVPRRGYRFIAPVEAPAPEKVPEAAALPPPSLPGTTTVRLQKALWTNIAELRVAEERRRRLTYISILVVGLAVAALATYVILIKS
jgi:DNA-binding winged helix-turn-helix (wHTH) protein